MKKKIISRGMMGFPIGITISYAISIFSSLCFADGYYSPCGPELISIMGNEINAVILQALLSGVLGTVFAAGSVIWEIEQWSIVKQSGIYFLIGSVISMPIAYILRWMEHSISGFLSYFGIFALIFIIIWLIKYAVIRQHVKKLNEHLNEIEHEK